MSVRVRFAPSPTGHLHIGSLRVAIFNWLFARHEGGKYLVRIEDTDLERSKKEYVDSILGSLEWMSLMPDEKIVFQMSRLDEHKKAALTLLNNGQAYPCFCEPKDKDVIGKYSGECRDKSYTKQDLEKPHAIRFKVPKNCERITFNDLIHGEITVEADQLDDFIILRRDGTPIYNFVVVVDDIYMQITHVIRGDDHISNTPKQVLLYNAFNKIAPKFAHLPMILGKDGSKLSKRDAATAAVEYKQAGYLADALFNYLVRLGWACGDQELFSKKELIDLFTLEGIGKKSAIFDIKKLDWLNGIYIRELRLNQFLEAINQIDAKLTTQLAKAWGDKLEFVFKLYQERAKSILSLANDIIALASEPQKLDLELIAKWKSDKTYLLVQDYIERLEVLEHLEHDELLNIAEDICEEYGVKLVELAQAMRLSFCGSVQSPGICDILIAIGRDNAISRMQRLLEEWSKKEPEHIVLRKV